METTRENFRAMLGLPAGKPSDLRLDMLLDDAKLAVEQDGVSVDHDKFEVLQRYRAAMLYGAFQDKGDNVVSKTIGGVSVDYGDQSAIIDGGRWEREYRALLNSVRGYLHRIA